MRTNLGGAIAQALTTTGPTPLALIALTDGIANDGSDDARAMNGLIDSRVPLIGVGFGSDQELQTLSLRHLEAPTTVAPRAAFSLSAEFEMLNAEQPLGFDLVLFRDGQMLQKRSVNVGKGSCLRIESFQLKEDAAGVHAYAAQLLPPNLPNLRCTNDRGSTAVRVADERALRVLYVEGDPSESGPGGNRILMASQRYGAGLSAVLCLQNFWRWRLAKDSEPQQFDRFWRQLFRWLGAVGRQEINIRFVDQDLRPPMDVRLRLERPASPANSLETNRQFVLQVQDSKKTVVHEEAVELQPSQEVEFKFHAPTADLYTVTVFDPAKTTIASRPIEIHDTNLELARTARNMETLSQWATASDGLAFKVEECPKASDLISQIKAKVEEMRRRQQIRRPVGINVWTLSLVLGCLGGGWLLRKRWALV